MTDSPVSTTNSAASALLSRLVEMRDSLKSKFDLEMEMEPEDKSHNVYKCLRKMSCARYLDHQIKSCEKALQLVKQGPVVLFEDGKDQVVTELELCVRLLKQVFLADTIESLQTVLNTWGPLFTDSKKMKSTKLCSKTIQNAVMFQTLRVMMNQMTPQ